MAAGIQRTYKKQQVIDGNYYSTAHIDMDELVAKIEKGLGSRLSRLRADPDAMQDFWLGVLENVPRATKTADPIPYLINKGFFRSQMNKRSEGRHRYIAYCSKCDRHYNYTNTHCPNCNSDLEYLGRTSDVDLLPQTSLDRGVDLQLDIERFVDQIENETDRYVAKRWLIDRADLMLQNYQKQIAFEVGVHQSNIAKRVMRIKQHFVLWYNR